jgi:hypothetical protein
VKVKDLSGKASQIISQPANEGPGYILELTAMAGSYRLEHTNYALITISHPQTQISATAGFSKYTI